MSRRGAALHLAMRVFLLLAAAGLAVLATMKLEDRAGFVEALGRHGLWPDAAAPLLGWAVPLGELLLATLVLQDAAAKRVTFRPLVLLASMLCAFSAYAMLLVVFPPQEPAPCGCALTSAPVESWGGICVRNGVGATALAALALLGSRLDAAQAVRPTGQGAVDSVSASPSSASPPGHGCPIQLS